MRGFLLLPIAVLAACTLREGAASERPVIVEEISGEAIASLTSTKTLLEPIQLEGACAYPYQEIIRDASGKRVHDVEQDDGASYLIDWNTSKCSSRPERWYVLSGAGHDSLQATVRSVRRVTNGDYTDGTAAPSLKDRMPTLVEITGDSAEFYYVISPYYYRVEVSMKSDRPGVVSFASWQ